MGVKQVLNSVKLKFDMQIASLDAYFALLKSFKVEQ